MECVRLELTPVTGPKDKASIKTAKDVSWKTQGVPSPIKIKVQRKAPARKEM